jgi:hypothetical protein
VRRPAGVDVYTVTGEPRQIERAPVLSTSYAFGGHNAALVIGPVVAGAQKHPRDPILHEAFAALVADLIETGRRAEPEVVRNVGLIKRRGRTLTPAALELERLTREMPFRSV